MIYRKKTTLTDQELHDITKLNIQVTSMRSVLDRAMNNQNILPEQLLIIVEKYVKLSTDREIKIFEIVSSRESDSVLGVKHYTLENYSDRILSYCVEIPDSSEGLLK